MNMNWKTGKRETLQNEICKSSVLNTYIMNISPTDYTPPEGDETGNDVKYLSIERIGRPCTADLRNIIYNAQTEYDSSDHVNSFYVNGIAMWLPKEERLSLRNSSTIQKNNGLSETTLWTSFGPISIQIDLVLQLLDTIEMYAVECYNNTQKHLQEIKALQTRRDMFSYDITAGYPTPLQINIPMGESENE